MYYIIYLSTATNLLSDAELKEILLKSNGNNQKLQVTGMLLYSEGNIIQVIEGELQIIKALYTRIASDSRHRGIILLSEGDIAERNFPDWSMGFRTVSANDFAQLTGYQKVNSNWFLSQAPDKEEHDVLTFLKIFYQTNIIRF